MTIPLSLFSRPYKSSIGGVTRVCESFLSTFFLLFALAAAALAAEPPLGGSNAYIDGGKYDALSGKGLGDRSIVAGCVAIIDAAGYSCS